MVITRDKQMADSRHKPSLRFTANPKDILPVGNLYTRPASEAMGYVIPDNFRIKHLPARRAYAGADTWRVKGGMSGGAAGCCKGVASHLGAVPRAFLNYKG